MSNKLHYLTHPEVEVDPKLPVPQWRLSDKGSSRVRSFSKNNSLTSIKQIVSSLENKAVETAKILASALDLKIDQRQMTHENDRSSTGYMQAADFELAADTFFANPNESFKGWETAAHAQMRIVGEVRDILSAPVDGDVLIVGHGAVGTLLYCHFANQSINRKFDQKGGGGNYFSVDLETLEPLHHWMPMETF